MWQNVMSYLQEYLWVLLVTIVVEELVAVLWKTENKKIYFLVLFVNMVTNPLANAIYFVVAPGVQKNQIALFALWLAIEVVVWYTEGNIYGKFAGWMKHPWLFALIANAASIIIGFFYTKIL